MQSHTCMHNTDLDKTKKQNKRERIIKKKITKFFGNLKMTLMKFDISIN